MPNNLKKEEEQIPETYQLFPVTSRLRNPDV
jgi:hypothetical protein